MYGLIYLSELAPKHIRGLMSSLYQLSVNVGILVAYAIGAYNTPTNNWRWTLGLGAIPAAIFAVGMMCSPQSPRWLIRDNQIEKARKVLQKVRVTDDEVEKEIAGVQESLKTQDAGLHELFHSYRPVLTLLFVLTVFQVFTGINAAVYYAPEIFTNLGFAALHRSAGPEETVGDLFRRTGSACDLPVHLVKRCYDRDYYDFLVCIYVRIWIRPGFLVICAGNFATEGQSTWNGCHHVHAVAAERDLLPDFPNSAFMDWN